VLDVIEKGGSLCRERAPQPHHVENGEFNGTLEVLTLSSAFLAFFASFFAFLATFRISLVFFDIERTPIFAFASLSGPNTVPNSLHCS
jgi:hypothetical protein